MAVAPFVSVEAVVRLGWETAYDLAAENGLTHERAPSGGRSLLRFPRHFGIQSKAGDGPRPKPK